MGEASPKSKSNDHVSRTAKTKRYFTSAKSLKYSSRERPAVSNYCG